jgi:hypothetical protein
MRYIYNIVYYNITVYDFKWLACSMPTVKILVFQNIVHTYIYKLYLTMLASTTVAGEADFHEGREI